jgi:hypothetical protein
MSFFNNLNKITYEPYEDLTFFDRCSVCGNKSDELYRCERCDELYCDNCHLVYNQFTQIDYNCCRTCGDSIEDSKRFD